jgi:hypothetical protein
MLKTLILAVVGVPAALAATWAVEMPYIGRKGTLAISCGQFIYPPLYLFIFPSTLFNDSFAEDRDVKCLPFSEYNRKEL